MNTPPNPDDMNDVRLLASVLQDIDPILVMKSMSVHLLRVHGMIQDAIDAASATLAPSAPALRRRADDIAAILSRSDNGLTIRESTTLAAELVRLHNVLDVIT